MPDNHMVTGVNSSEEFVYEVCRKSFLSLWNYVNPQGSQPRKELCDILVVCDPHVLVVSVKDVGLKDSGNIDVDWNRWQRKAVDASIRQIQGAIRWLDRADSVVAKDGTTGLPLPPLERRTYHRIAVAFGGRREVPLPCSVKRGNSFFHVLDEKSFYLLLRHLDTMTDFVQYLADKEQFLSRAGVVMTGGEEDLLAIYLHKGRKFPRMPKLLVLEDDLWEVLSSKPEFVAKLRRDQDSYVWDRLIESFCEGDFVEPKWEGPGMPDSERSLRFLALEDRFARRLLGHALAEFLGLAAANRVRSRCLTSPSGVGYVFFAYDPDMTPDLRKAELLGRCFASLYHFVDCFTVIGIGVNIRAFSGRSPLEAFRDPDLDDRLACYSQAMGLFVQGVDHPQGEVDVDALLFLVDACGPREVQEAGDVFSVVKLLVELLSSHTPVPLPFATCAP